MLAIAPSVESSTTARSTFYALQEHTKSNGASLGQEHVAHAVRQDRVMRNGDWID